MMVPGGLKTEYIIFSLKTFVAGMLAYWIAIEWGLANPYWAVGTVYIIANPLSGAIASKAVYRLAGTFLGAVVIIALVPNLVFAPTLLVLAVALWCSFCLFVSMLDRSPRSYVFMLAGYTVALTGLTLVNAPETSFSVATSRVEEIALGIICAAFVNRLVMPQHAGPLLSVRVEGWLENTANLTRDVLSGVSEGPQIIRERHKLAADAVGLRAFTSQVAYEGARGRALTERMQALQQRMVKVLPLLSEIADLHLALKKNGEMKDAQTSLLMEIHEWCAEKDETALNRAEQLRAAIAEERQRMEDNASGWNDLLWLRMTRRLADLVDVWADCQTLRLDMASGKAHRLRKELATQYRQSLNLHTDYGVAVLAATSVFILIVVASALWIYSGWTYGGSAVQIGAVLCCVLATMDNATPVLRKVFRLMLIAALTALVYQFAVMPLIDGFVPLIGALGLVLIPAGILLAAPASWLMGFQISVNLIYMLTLGNQMSTNFGAFANIILATFAGLGAATIIMATVRAVGSEQSARRILRSGWNVVIDATMNKRRLEPDFLVARMLDRLGLIVPRLAGLPQGSSVLEADLLRDLRVGLDVLKIQRNKHALKAQEVRLINDLLLKLADEYCTKLKDQKTAPEALAEALDAGLNRLIDEQAEAPLRVRDALVGLRSSLCPQAPPSHLQALEWRLTA
ncbi:FUSC family protein [Martelella mediterranea]|uniref:Putative membrane protein YccC n=1 Tax=Martelella mediterranea TaxID=293089 RepID=A0A4R3NTF8_9HYPH|nr:FUSC family protein [Martelella mediterranea]TCT39060.1 putative membrane protein YccC [Martelella mediterranea]